MRIALIISAALVALLLWLIWIIAAKAQQPRRMANPAVPVGRYRSLTFNSGGIALQAWLLFPDNEMQFRDSSLLPLVIVAHGWGSNRSRVLRYTQPLLDEGLAVLLYDARSHGDSGAIKAPSALMFRDDIQAAVLAARKLPDIDPQRIAVLGHSLGGFGTLLALGAGLPVRAVVTDSMPTRFETMLKADLKRKKLPFFPLGYFIPAIWLLRAGISRAEYKAAQIPYALAANEAGAGVPVLMIHSKGDSFIPADDLRILAEQWPVDAFYVEGSGHSQSEQDPRFWSKVIPFLKENLL
ncbi:alpha/beta hydrolase [Paenibacillus sepulcri]